MSITNVTALRKNLYGTVENVAQYNEAVTVTSKSGNVVILSESEYNAMMETIYLTILKISPPVCAKPAKKLPVRKVAAGEILPI